MWGAVWVLVWGPAWEERRERDDASQKRAATAPWGPAWVEVWGTVWGTVWGKARVKMRDSAQDEARAYCGTIFRIKQTSRGRIPPASTAQNRPRT